MDKKDLGGVRATASPQPAGGPAEKPIPPIDSAIKARFASKVKEVGDCLEWQAHRDRGGYGQFSIGGSLYGAHRVAFAMSGRMLAKGHVVDHECRNRSCVNPDHLRAVDIRTNNIENSVGFSAVNAAKRLCYRGHVLDGANLHVRTNGSRRCQECKRISDRKFKARLRLRLTAKGGCEQ